MSRKQVLASQAAWEQEKKKRDAVEKRQKMNEVIRYHFIDEQRAGFSEGRINSPDLSLEGINTPEIASPSHEDSALNSPTVKVKESLADYEMKKKGLMPTGNWMTSVIEEEWQVPGGFAMHAFVDGDWQHLLEICPVVASRQILVTGKHLFRVHIKPRDSESFLAMDGQIKIGFFESDLDPKSSWMSDECENRAWYYRSLGNVYNGPRMAEDGFAPGFEPMDIITAVVNINEGTAIFSKKRIVQGTEKERIMESDETKIEGVSTNGVRFGIQFEREGPGVVLLDYEDVTAQDGHYRAERWVAFGLTHIEKSEWAEAIECFKKAVKHYHEAGERVLRKEAALMLEEAQQLLKSGGIEAAVNSPFRLRGVIPGSKRK